MYPSSDQFNSRQQKAVRSAPDKKKEKAADLAWMKKREYQDDRSSALGKRSQDNHKPLKPKPCATCGGSGNHPTPNTKPKKDPNVPSSKKEYEEDFSRRHERYTTAPDRDKTRVLRHGEPGHHSFNEHPQKYGKQFKKDEFKKDKINKKPPHYNDDDKGNAGGASVPRKPKPKGPQFPDRVVERKTDPEYSRKMDRYRVAVSG